MAAEILLTSDAASLRQKWYLFRAEQALDAQCMQRLGFRYLVTSPGPEPSTRTVTEDAVSSSYPATYGVPAMLSGAIGHSSGNSSGTTQSGQPPEDRYIDSLREPVRTRYLSALEGTPGVVATLRLPSGAAGTYTSGGCVGYVRKRLYGSVRAALEDPLVPQDMTRLLGIFLNSYHPFLSALHAWRQCMASAGWRFATPEAAIESVQILAAKGASQAEMDRRQIPIADADVGCDARSHLRMHTSEARIKFVRQQPRQILAELQGIYITRERAVRRALQVLSSARRGMG